MASLFGVEALRQLVQVVDDLRDVGLSRIISLPRIVVVGTQSSGKSSVLESVVGMDFLPRGDGVVTRRPLELRLVHLADSENIKPYAVFDVDKEQKFNDFEKVRERIESLTDEIAGSNKGIIDNPIILTVYSPSCPNLTLIDLPGVTRVPMKGSDQGEDIEAITRNMAAKYIEDSRTIILAVISANQDMSTSDALQLARRYDPEGVRTIGVLTKLDLMDQGTDAVRMIRGDDIHLTLGYVAIKNRSKADITAKKKVTEALLEEKAWFQNHPIYGKLGPGYTGTDSLVEKLTKVLFIHIKRFLPDIKRDVYERKAKVEDRLQELGDGVPADLQMRLQMMWTNITTYVDMMNNSIRGKFDPKLQKYLEKEFSSQQPRCGTQIRACFNNLLTVEYNEDMTQSLDDAEINKALRDLEGDALPGFPSPDTFEMLVTPHLQKLMLPSLDCVTDITSVLLALTRRMASLVFDRFPDLADRVFEITAEIIEDERAKTKLVVENLIASHTGYLFTNDDDYLTLHGLMKPNGPDETAPPVPQPPPQPTALENVGNMAKSGVNTIQSTFSSQSRHNPGYSSAFVGEIRNRLNAYFKLCVRNIRDAVPKAIGYNLVRNVQNKLAFVLHQRLANPDDLLTEPKEIAEERKHIVSQIEILSKAAAVLSRDIEQRVGKNIDHEYESKYNQLMQGGGPGNFGSQFGGQPAKPKQPAQSGFGAPGGNALFSSPTPNAAIPQQVQQHKPAPPPQQAGGGLFGGSTSGLGTKTNSLFAGSSATGQKKTSLFD